MPCLLPFRIEIGSGGYLKPQFARQLRQDGNNRISRAQHWIVQMPCQSIQVWHLRGHGNRLENSSQSWGLPSAPRSQDDIPTVQRSRGPISGFIPQAVSLPCSLSTSYTCPVSVLSASPGPTHTSLFAGSPGQGCSPGAAAASNLLWIYFRAACLLSTPYRAQPSPAVAARASSL